MANHIFENVSYSLEANVVRLYGKFTVGAANAITINRGKGIASISRTAAGKVTITLSEVYASLLNVSVIKSNASAAAEALLPSVVSEDVASAKTVVVGFSNAAVPAFTDLTSGDVVFVEIVLKNSVL